MFFKKIFILFVLILCLIFTPSAMSGVIKSAVKTTVTIVVVKKSIEIILKKSGKEISKKIISKNKDKIVGYIKDNPKMRNNVLDEIEKISKKIIDKEKDINNINLIKNNTRALKEEINMLSPEVIPKGIKLPKNGVWSGAKGDSRFFPAKVNKDSKINIKKLYEKNGNTGIKYNKGNPNFKNVSEVDIKIEGLTGKNSNDFPLVYDKIIKDNIKIRGETFKTRSEVENFLSKERLTIHHEKGGTEVRIVDRDIHEVYRHNGGASELRNK